MILKIALLFIGSEEPGFLKKSGSSVSESAGSRIFCRTPTSTCTEKREEQSAFAATVERTNAICASGYKNASRQRIALFVLPFSYSRLGKTRLNELANE